MKVHRLGESQIAGLAHHGSLERIANRRPGTNRARGVEVNGAVSGAPWRFRRPAGRIRMYRI